MTMIKTMFALGALTLAVAAPAAAQMATGAPSGAPLPKCSATVRDSCDQSTTSEKNAMTAAQAEASGGVGDRKSDQAAKSSMAEPMTHRPMMHHHMMHKHHMMMKKTPAMSTADTPAEPMPK